MACDSCNSNTPSYFQLPSPNCGVNATKCIPTDSSCVLYTGPALNCLELSSNSTVEEIIQAVDSKVCQAGFIPWDTFNYGCLTDPDVFNLVITNAQQFAEGVASSICIVNSNLTELIEDVDEAITELSNILDDINHPGPIAGCDVFSLSESDTIETSFEKTAIALCVIQGVLDNAVTLPEWDQCFTVDPMPTTLWDAFNVLIDQICTLKGQIDSFTPTLPTFNNLTTCLASPGATDSLVDTIIKIRTRLCELPTYDVDNVVWDTCITQPVSTTLEGALSYLVGFIQDAYALRIVSFSSDFVVTQQSLGDPCSGFTVSLNPLSGAGDKLVALDASDSTPNYLLNKMLPGTNITFDTVSSPGAVILNVQDEFKVKAANPDTTPDFLINKISTQGDISGSIALNVAYEGITEKVQLTPQINFITLTGAILNTISSNPGLLAQFCALACGCQPCGTTTTTTTASGGGTFRLEWRNLNATFPVNAGVEFTQYTPNVTLYSNLTATLAASQTISTGTYPVTTINNPVTGKVTVKNNESNAMTYNVYVVDNTSTPIPGGTIQSGTIPGLGQVVIDPYTYGTPVNGIVLHVDVNILT